MKKLVSLFMLLAMVMVVFTACSGKEKNTGSAIEGKWVMESITFMGETATVEEYQEALGIEGDTVLEFKADGTVTLSDYEGVLDGTYEFADNIATVTIEGEAINVTLEDGKLIMADESLEMSVVYAKQ